MLADASTSTVNCGGPAGGAIGSIQVGFSSTPSTSASPTPPNVRIVAHRRRGTIAGRRQPYQPKNNAPAIARASHSAGGISGSKLRVVIDHVRKNFSASDFAQQARHAGHGQPRPEMIALLGFIRGGRPEMHATAAGEAAGQNLRIERPQVAFLGGNGGGGAEHRQRPAVRAGIRPAQSSAGLRQMTPPALFHQFAMSSARRFRRHDPQARRRPGAGWQRHANGSPQAIALAGPRLAEQPSRSSPMSGTNACERGRSETREVGIEDGQLPPPHVVTTRRPSDR